MKPPTGSTSEMGMGVGSAPSLLPDLLRAPAVYYGLFMVVMLEVGSLNCKDAAEFRVHSSELGLKGLILVSGNNLNPLRCPKQARPERSHHPGVPRAGRAASYSLPIVVLLSPTDSILLSCHHCIHFSTRCPQTPCPNLAIVCFLSQLSAPLLSSLVPLPAAD